MVLLHWSFSQHNIGTAAYTSYPSISLLLKPFLLLVQDLCPELLCGPNSASATSQSTHVTDPVALSNGDGEVSDALLGSFHNNYTGLQQAYCICAYDYFREWVHASLKFIIV